MSGVRIPDESPNKKDIREDVFFVCSGDSNKEGAGESLRKKTVRRTVFADMGKERRALREGGRQSAEKIPDESPNKKEIREDVFFVCSGDSNKEGAGEACGRKQTGGLFSPTEQRAKRGDSTAVRDKITCSLFFVSFKNGFELRQSGGSLFL